MGVVVAGVNIHVLLGAWGDCEVFETTLDSSKILLDVLPTFFSRSTYVMVKIRVSIIKVIKPLIFLN